MPVDVRDIDRMLGDPWREPIPPHCPRCGFNLSGADGVRCPECGGTYIRRVVADYARRLQFEMKRLQAMNRHVALGAKIAACGLALLGLGILRQKATPSLGEATRVIGVVAGVLSIALGLNVLRIKRLPDWTVEYLREPPAHGAGLLTAALGVVLLLLSVAT